MRTTENGMNFVEQNDQFEVANFKTVTTKRFPDRLMGKILTAEGEEIFTSAAKIVKILSELNQKNVDLTNVIFTVIKAGEYNGNAVLSLKTDNAAVQRQINIILF